MILIGVATKPLLYQKNRYSGRIDNFVYCPVADCDSGRPYHFAGSGQLAELQR